MPTEQRVAPVRGAHRLSPEFWAIIGIGVTVLIGLGAGQMGIRAEFRGEIESVRDEFRGEIKGVRGEIQGVRGEVQSLRDDHREDFMLLLQEIREVRELVVANGKVLARIEQALFGPPAKVTPADRE